MDTPTQPRPTQVFSSEYSQILVEVDYQDGAAPYTGSAGFGLSTRPDVWVILRDNLNELFLDPTTAQLSKSITTPSQLGQMEKLTGIVDTDFSVADILELAGLYRDNVSGQTADGSWVAAFYVVFLDGYFEDGNGRNEGVLGVSLGSTGVIAMFKPVIESTRSALTQSERFVEQVTLVHELGHALGLVNNGLDMVNPHQDEAHGRHCANDDCGMFWLNEGAAGLGSFSNSLLGRTRNIVFDQDCILDARNAISPVMP